MKKYLLLLLSLLAVSEAYYIPHASKKEYKEGEEVKAQTVKLTSVPLALPFGFYEFKGKELPFCQPSKNFKVGDYSGDLGQKLSGDRIQDSAYQFTALKSETCKTIQTIKTDAECPLHDSDWSNLKDLVKWEYRAQITLDGLPVAVRGRHGKYNKEIGIPIGKKSNDSQYLNNHIDFIVHYHNASGNFAIVGFTAVPRSINKTATCGTPDEVPLSLEGRSGKSDDMGWTYSVTWQASNTSWDTRWNEYLAIDEELHWVSFSYAIIVTLVLAIFLGIVLMKIIRSSVAKYSSFEDVEESGWKTLHGDVFRAPRHFMVLSLLVGIGAQILASAFIVLLLGAIGYVSPAASGSLNLAIVVVYPMMGFVGGYTSARVYTRLGGGRKRRNAVLTAVGFNGVLFLIWFIADIVLWSQSSSAGSVGTFFSVVALWLCVNTPLTFLGAFFAHRRPVGTNPTGTNTIPRMIPAPPWYSHPALLTPLLAILPFGVAFNELYDMMDAMWSHHVYYMFGMVLVVFLLLTIIIAEVSVVLCYFQLANENYHWWWRAFHIPATVCAYIFLMAMFYVGSNLQLKSAASVFLYLTYTSIILLAFFVFMSSIAFYACWTFVHRIYCTLHVD